MTNKRREVRPANSHELLRKYENSPVHEERTARKETRAIGSGNRSAPRSAGSSGYKNVVGRSPRSRVHSRAAAAASGPADYTGRVDEERTVEEGGMQRRREMPSEERG